MGIGLGARQAVLALGADPSKVITLTLAPALSLGVDPSKILPKWGRWSSRERQLREIAENKRVH